MSPKKDGQTSRQSLRWYFDRLRVMSASEVVGRVRDTSMSTYEQLWLQHQKPRAVPAPFETGALTFDRSNLAVHVRNLETLLGDVRLRADRILDGSLIFLGVNTTLGRPPNWRLDHRSGRTTPLVFWSRFRPPYDGGISPKHVWEPNRHQHWTLLARAYYLMSEQRWATEVVEQWSSWIVSNPPLLGINWASPMELGIRLLSWSYAYEFLGDAVPNLLRRQIGIAVCAQANHLLRHLSRGSSANNHLIGESVGLYVTGLYFKGLPGAARWQAVGRSELLHCMDLQVAPDGSHREQAIEYHCFVLELFLLAALVGRRNGDYLTPDFWRRLEKMIDVVAALVDSDGRLPRLGDGDDAVAIQLDDSPSWIRARSLLATGAVLFSRQEFASLATGWDERTYWLTGEPTLELFGDPKPPKARSPSVALPDAGLYVMRSAAGTWAKGNFVPVAEVVIDAGPMGLKPMAAHGHSDALSFNLTVRGRPILGDPGTYVYHGEPRWRNWFKGTGAHNTLQIDGVDQAVSRGPTLWTDLPRVTVLAWDSGESSELVAEHDGYSRLAGHPIHRRSLRLSNDGTLLEIIDSIRGTAPHAAAIHLHFAPGIRVAPGHANLWEASAGQIMVAVTLDCRCSATLYEGSLEPIAGWWSAGFGRREPAVELVATCNVEPTDELITLIDLGRPSP